MGEYPKRWEVGMEGIVVQQFTAESALKVYQGNGKWTLYAKPLGSDAKTLSVAEFDELIAVLDDKPGWPKKGK